MELKVTCDCGQKYKFDVEPVNGQMPFTVNCPVCGTDGTQKANSLLYQTAAPAPVPVLIVEAPAAPPPVSSGLRISGLAPAPVGGAPAPVAPPLSSAPPPIGAPMRPGRIAAVAADPNAPAKEANFGMGILGSFLGTLVGGILYFFVLTLVGFKSILSLGLASILVLLAMWIGSAFIIVGIGYLAGAGAVWLGRCEGRKELGIIAAVLAICGIIGAEYCVSFSWWHQARQFANDSLYSMSVDTAKEVVAAVPTGSDTEIRNYLAKQASDDGDDAKPDSITTDQIKDFRENQLPDYQGLASGQITKEQFLAKGGLNHAKNSQGATDDTSDDEGTAKAIFLALLLRKSNIFMMIASAGLAYKTVAKS